MSTERIFEYKNLVNLLIFLFPLTFILGNFAINISLTLICILGLIVLKKDIFDLNINLEIILLIFFFSFLIFTTVLNIYLNDIVQNFSLFSEERFIKSILFLRYLLFAFVISKLLDKNLINLKIFFISCLIFCSFVSLDIILQFLSGKDLFGYSGSLVNKSGPFGDEHVAGGYLLRFFLFSLIGIQILFSKNKKNRDFIFFLFTFISIISIFYSGNKMSFAVLPLCLILISLFLKSSRIYILAAVILSTITIMQSIKYDKQFKIYYNAFYINIQETPKHFFKKLYIDNFASNEKKEILQNQIKDNSYGWSVRTGHKQIFLTAIDVWKQNKFLGGGIRSFRINCSKTLDNHFRMCEGHPHNYYLEFLTDTGIFGLILILFFISVLVFKNNKKFLKKKLFKNKNFFYLPFYLYLFIEFFPLKSTGSFFSTFNSTYIFLLLGVLLSKKISKSSTAT